MNEPLSYEIPHRAVDTINDALIAEYRKAETSLESLYDEPLDEDDIVELSTRERKENHRGNNKSIAKIALDEHSSTNLNKLHENANHMNAVRDLIDHHDDRLL